MTTKARLCSRLVGKVLVRTKIDRDIGDFKWMQITLEQRLNIREKSRNPSRELKAWASLPDSVRDCVFSLTSTYVISECCCCYSCENSNREIYRKLVLTSIRIQEVAFAGSYKLQTVR